MSEHIGNSISAMKDKETTNKMCDKVLFGIDESESEE